MMHTNKSMSVDCEWCDMELPIVCAPLGKRWERSHRQAPERGLERGRKVVRHEIADFVCTTNGSSWNVVLRMVSKHASRVLEGRDYRTGSASKANIYEDLSYRKENLKCRLGKN